MGGCCPGQIFVKDKTHFDFVFSWTDVQQFKRSETEGGIEPLILCAAGCAACSGQSNIEDALYRKTLSKADAAETLPASYQESLEARACGVHHDTEGQVEAFDGPFGECHGLAEGS